MTSEPQKTANRQNAKRSRGPKTSAGKAKSSRNSRRHGLAVPVIADGTLSEARERLGRLFGADWDCTPNRYRACMYAAETVLELRRVEAVEVSLLNAELQKMFNECWEQVLQERLWSLDGASDSGANRAQYEARAFAALAKQLKKIERYKRLAFAHWKRALPSLFDGAEAI
jgi:hypothetical protein